MYLNFLQLNMKCVYHFIFAKSLKRKVKNSLDIFIAGVKTFVKTLVIFNNFHKYYCQQLSALNKYCTSFSLAGS